MIDTLCFLGDFHGSIECLRYDSNKLFKQTSTVLFFFEPFQINNKHIPIPLLDNKYRKKFETLNAMKCIYQYPS